MCSLILKGFVQDTADEQVYASALVIQSDDPDLPVLDVKLHGAFTGTGGASELLLDVQLGVSILRSLQTDSFQRYQNSTSVARCHCSRVSQL